LPWHVQVANLGDNLVEFDPAGLRHNPVFSEVLSTLALKSGAGVMNPSTKRGHVATARIAGRDASSTRPQRPASASLSPKTMASYAKVWSQ
jgi:hypothetical protein